MGCMDRGSRTIVADRMDISAAFSPEGPGTFCLGLSEVNPSSPPVDGWRQGTANLCRQPRRLTSCPETDCPATAKSLRYSGSRWYCVTAWVAAVTIFFLDWLKYFLE